MTRLVIIILLIAVPAAVQGQSFSANDLLDLSTLAPKSFDNYMGKKGFFAGPSGIQDDAMAITFLEKRKKKNDPDTILRSVDLYKKENAYCFALHTSSWNEYVQSRKELVKAGFLCNLNPDTNKAVPLFFQKRNLTVETTVSVEDDIAIYNFLLRKREIPNPAAIQFAEDLLQFDSHEYLATCFGDKNVKKDVYYFNETELRKCTVLFPNTSQQAVFIWNDQSNLRDLSYVLISGILPTVSSVQFTGYVSQNKWMPRSGLFSGMSLKELIRLNGADFKFYGRESEFAFMISPDSKGEIDFQTTGIMLGCLDCQSNKLLDKELISAQEAVDKNLILHVFYIMVNPSGRSEPVSR